MREGLDKRNINVITKTYKQLGLFSELPPFKQCQHLTLCVSWKRVNSRIISHERSKLQKLNGSPPPCLKPICCLDFINFR